MADDVAVSIEIGSMGSSAQHDPASAPGDSPLVVSFLTNSVFLLFPASSSNEFADSDARKRGGLRASFVRSFVIAVG